MVLSCSALLKQAGSRAQPAKSISSCKKSTPPAGLRLPPPPPPPAAPPSEEVRLCAAVPPTHGCCPELLVLVKQLVLQEEGAQSPPQRLQAARFNIHSSLQAHRLVVQGQMGQHEPGSSSVLQVTKQDTPEASLPCNRGIITLLQGNK